MAKYINNTEASDPNATHAAGAKFVKAARYATRVGTRRFKTLDAHLLQPTLETLPTVVKSFLTGHQVTEIVKGLFLSNPKLVSAKTEAKLIEAILQFSPEARRVGVASLTKIFGEAPLLKIQRVISLLLNNDGDVERECHDEWLAWRKARDKAYDGDPRPRALLTSWTKRAQRALAVVEGANATRDQMAEGLKSKVPTLRVKAGPKDLTTARISTINTLL
jgi:hypothetical protein